jgi:hypothetical protein
MLPTWTPPAIVRSETRAAYQKAVRPQSPNAIIWTGGEEAYEGGFLERSTSDIDTIKKWIERERDLARIREFRDNWDGLDADAPDKTVMLTADFFLRVLKDREPASPPMRVVLSADGSVAFEWAYGDKFVQAEIGDSVTVEWMIAVQGEATRFEVEFLEELSPSGAAKQGQAWQPAPAVVDEPAYASAR